MKLLLLGGTADARELADGLQRLGVEVIYSIAGLVRQPQLECRVVSGGFSAGGGLAAFLQREAIDAILDATHPYAGRMSATAADAARAQGLPLWRYQRPAWQAQAGNDWHEFGDWSMLADRLAGYRSVFFSAGQLTQAFVDELKERSADGQRQVLRTAIEPEIDLPASMSWIGGIGPFDIDGERALFDRYRFDALVSKNSGGAATAAKLEVARERGVPVYLLQRPALVPADAEFGATGQCVEFIAEQNRASA